MNTPEEIQLRKRVLGKEHREYKTRAQKEVGVIRYAAYQLLSAFCKPHSNARTSLKSFDNLDDLLPYISMEEGADLMMDEQNCLETLGEDRALIFRYTIQRDYTLQRNITRVWQNIDVLNSPE